MTWNVLARHLGGQWTAEASAQTTDISLSMSDGPFLMLSETTLADVQQIGVGSGGSETADTGEGPNECQEFAEELTEITKSVSRSGFPTMQQAGWAMMLSAKIDPWGSTNPPRGTGGFRPELLVDQGTDVYRHIMGHAGTVLATETGGYLAHLYEIHIDMKQLYQRRSGAYAEVVGSLAGREVGYIMRGAASRPFVSVEWEAITRQIRHVICQ